MLERGQRSHAARDHQLKLARLRSVRKRPYIGPRRDGNASRQLVCETRARASQLQRAAAIEPRPIQRVRQNIPNRKCGHGRRCAFRA